MAKLLSLHGFTARRGFQARGGEEQPDIVTDFPFHCECKYVERLNVWDAYDQACNDAVEPRAPLVFFKKNGRKPMVALQAELFIILVKEALTKYAEHQSAKSAK